MVLMKGSKRVFEIPSIETSNSSTTRTVSIYGVTSYNDITNNIIPIKSNATGTATTSTLNINNLGAIDIKYYKNGVKSPIDISNWVSNGQIYYISYDGTDFVLITNSNSSSSPSIEAYNVPTNIISLTSSSTTQDIRTAFTYGSHTSLNFIDVVYSGAEIIISDNTNRILVNYSLVLDSSDNLQNIILEFIYDNVFYKQTYTLANNDLNSVVVETSDLLLRNGNTIQY